MTSDKPTALWSLYFNQATPDPTCVTDLPSNVHALLLPGNTLGFGEALQQVLSNQNNQNRLFIPLRVLGVVTPHDGLYRAAPPERGTIFRLYVYETSEMSQVEVCE